MTSVAIVYRKDKLNARKEAPIHFRIIKNRKASYIASGIMIPAQQWNESKSKVKTTHPNSARLNSYLSNKFTEIQDTVLQHETTSKSLTSKSLKEKVFGKRPSDFFAFAGTVVEQYRKEGRVGTGDKNRSVLAKLRVYRPTLAFSDITPRFLAIYEAYLREHHGNCSNTIAKDMKFIRRVVNDAVRSDLIEQDSSAFRKYKLKEEKTSRDYLTADELGRLESCSAAPGTLQSLCKDLFVFACYAGGLRISDVLKLRWQNFDGTHLHITIAKTGAQIAIKVPQKGLELMSGYGKENGNKEDFIFPLLASPLDINNPVAVHAAIRCATTQVNRNLKTLATIAGIKKRLSFHISRHTFAVQALRKGITIDKVSKIMAHSNIRETLIYAKVANADLDLAMEAFND